MTTPSKATNDTTAHDTRVSKREVGNRAVSGVRDRWRLLFCAALLLWNLNYASFGNPDEGRYASASLEMAHPFDGAASDWIVPHLNTIPRLNKPPLIYWLTAGSFRVFGVGEWAGRLVPALSAVAVLLMVWAMGRAMFGRRAGILGALVWASALFPFVLARVLNTDMLLCACMTLAWWGIWRTLEGEPEANKRATRDDLFDKAPHEYSWAGPLLAGTGLGLALLAKGPVGIALPLLVTFVYLCVARRRHRVLWLRVLGALILAVGIAAPWYLAAASREPDFLGRFFLQENVARFSSNADIHKKPFYSYIPIVLLGMLPWTPFLFFAVLRFKRRDAANLPDETVETHGENAGDVKLDEANASRARLYLWLWAGLLVLFFSASGTKLPTYVLPAFPALALLAGEAMDDLLRGREGLLKRTAPRIFLGFTLLVNAALVFAAWKLLSNDKILPRREGLNFAAWSTGVLLAGSLLSLWAWRGRRNSSGAAISGGDFGGGERRWKRLIAAQALTIALLYVSLLSMAQRFTLYEDAGPMMRALAPYVKPDDRFVEFKGAAQFTPIFHLARPVEFIGFDNNSGLSEEAIARSPFFSRAKGQTLAAVLSDTRRVWVLLRRKTSNESLPPGAFPVARNSDLRLISNRPAPPGFVFDYVAPGKKMP